MCHQASVILSRILYISISLSAMCCPTSVTLSHRLYISKVYIHFLFWSLFNIYSPVSIVGSFQCRIILWALLTTFISQLGVLPSSVWKNGSVIKGSPRMWWRYELVTVPSKWSHCTHMLYCHVVLSCCTVVPVMEWASKWSYVIAHNLLLFFTMNKRGSAIQWEPQCFSSVVLSNGYRAQKCSLHISCVQCSTSLGLTWSASLPTMGHDRAHCIKAKWRIR